MNTYFNMTEKQKKTLNHIVSTLRDAIHVREFYEEGYEEDINLMKQHHDVLTTLLFQENEEKINHFRFTEREWKDEQDIFFDIINEAVQDTKKNILTYQQWTDNHGAKAYYTEQIVLLDIILLHFRQQ